MCRSKSKGGKTQIIYFPTPKLTIDAKNQNPIIRVTFVREMCCRQHSLSTPRAKNRAAKKIQKPIFFVGNRIIVKSIVLP